MTIPLLNFEGGPGILLSNFQESPGVPLLKFKRIPGPTFKISGGSLVRRPLVLVPLLHHAIFDLQAEM